ncbi:hypothetical protein HYX07_00275 [Candidatus Woesearchaeota archaeon]|nr:hypothetical protein [Candidatus Woesearchaeota archaeon]
MDENQEKANKILWEYLHQNKKPIKLDSNAMKILDIAESNHEYYEYIPDKLFSLLLEKDIKIEKLDSEFKHLFEKERKSNYISGWKSILIQKEVHAKFLIAQFIHEYAHHKFKIGEWNKDNYKHPKTPGESKEEDTCNILSCEYAEMNGFGKEYSKLIGL